MLSSASPLPDVMQPDASLAMVLAALATHEDKPLLIDYAGRRSQPGYHVTEVKAGSYVTLDCGANPDAWDETVLQVEDIPARDGDHAMTVRKFKAILAQVDKKVGLNGDARLTIEIGRPEEAMRVFDVGGVSVENDGVVLQLSPRAAICKPRHRAAQSAVSSCCSPAAPTGCC